MSYKRLSPEDLTLDAESVVSPTWSDDSVELDTFNTSSAQVASNTGNYYYNIYKEDPNVVGPNEPEPEVEFAIAFAHKYGSGSVDFTPSENGFSPSRVVYGQYRNLIYGDEETDVKFGGQPSDYFYVININRARYKEKLLPGSLNLTLDNTAGNPITLTDNSRDVNTLSFIDAGRVFEIVEGQNGSADSGNGYATTAIGSYGKFLPDVGVILLNGRALDISGLTGINLETGLDSNTNNLNINKLFVRLKEGNNSLFKLQSEETITSKYVFVRVKNKDFNYSTNPSYIDDSGELKNETMVNNPKTYITTAGLYNDSNDLIAVAKLSRPLLKDYSKEALLRVKLNY